jgi:hypothetical protein
MASVKRIVKRVALALGVLALAVFTLGYVGIHWGLTPIPRPPYGIRLQPLSPPLTKADLRPDNGAYDYMNAVAAMQHHQWSKDSERQIEAVTVGIISGDTNAIEQTLREIQPALELVRKGSKASSCQMPQIDLTTDIDALNTLRQLARLLIADGKWAEHHGDIRRASEDYLATVKLGTDCATGGPIFPDLVGDSIVGMGTRALRALAIQSANSSSDTRELRERLNRIASQKSPFAETLRYELTFQKEQLHHTAFAQSKWWWAVSESVTFRCFDAAFGDLIRDAERPFWESKAKAIDKKWTVSDRTAWLCFFNRPVARIFIAMMLPTIERTRAKSVHADVELNATSTVCALKSYELVHGSAPEDLSDLVPEFLPSIPIDSFDGKPLRYRHDGKEWALWSVGHDVKEDSAHGTTTTTGIPGKSTKTGDIYFKSTEPQDDLAGYLSKDKSNQPG